MEIWLDSYNTETIKKGNTLGILHGITTNPLLLSESEQEATNTLKSILLTYKGPIASQVTALQAQEMVLQGKKLFECSKQFIIKVPAVFEGFKAMKILKELKIPVMATAIYDLKQALLAFEAGASYGALYLGRLEDTEVNPMKVISSILSMIQKYYPDRKLLAASLRTKNHFLQCLELGVNAVTLKEPLFSWLIEDISIAKTSCEEFSKALAIDWLERW